MADMDRLKGKVVLITGAVGAIGSAIAAAVANEGGTAIRTDLPGRGDIDHALDVTSEEDWKRTIDAVERAPGRLDGLVNAAGIIAVGTVEDTDFATWRRVMAINLDGTFLGCKYGMRLLRRDGGAIVNISSVAARTGGLPSRAPYAATKGAIETFTRGLANEVGREGIRVNAVAPGMIETDMSSPILSSPAVKEQIASSIPIGRLGAPEEIAEAIAWLISPASRYVTGSVMTVSGGR